MPRGKKSTWVADYLHGTIPLSPVEKSFISTQIFNRLHNILQNSTVYFTYPSNRTSRFNHSLGCVHLTGEIFCNAILNSPEKWEGFFRAAEAALKTVETTAGKELQSCISSNTDAATLRNRSLGDDIAQIYSAALPHGLTDNQRYLFVHLFQAVRLVALLHDVGHPPFSHVTENALGRIGDYIEGGGPGAPVSAQRAEVEVLFRKFFGGKKPFHETLGETLSEILFTTHLRERKEAGAQDPELYFLLLQKHLVLSIFRETTPFLRGIHGIVDGPLDSDRLDYVQRDLAMSGFSKEPLRVDRLLRSFSLATYPANSREYRFAPSIRAIHNLEEFYRQRFQLYKYIIYHHRVAKFDGLLEHAIIELAKRHIDELGIAKPSSAPLKVGLPLLLKDDISGLWQVFERDSITVPKNTESLYIQWDDAWLLSVLRRAYFALGPSPKEILLVRLEELLSNRKKYFSFYKRAECFLDIDRAFILAAPDDFDWKAVMTKVDRVAGPGASSSDAFKRDYGLLTVLAAEAKKLRKSDGEAWEKLLSRFGYATTIICHLLANSTGSKTFNSLSFLTAAADKLAVELKLADVLLITKRFSTGVTDDFIVVNTSGAPVRICGVSRISEELRQAVLLFPPFFVFLYDGKGIPEGRLPKWREKFGQILWTCFGNWLNS